MAARADGEALHDHCILCGLGTVGICVAERLLGLGMRVVAVDRAPEPAATAWAAATGVPIIQGDFCSSVILEQAGVRAARALVAVSGSDLANLEAALEARTLNPRVRVVVRLFNEHMAAPLRQAVGNAAVLSVAALAAPSLAAAALHGNGGVRCFPADLDTPATAGTRAGGWWALLEAASPQTTDTSSAEGMPPLPEEAVVVYARGPDGTARLAPALSSRGAASDASAWPRAGPRGYGALLPLAALQRWHTNSGRGADVAPRAHGWPARLGSAGRRLAGGLLAAIAWPRAAFMGTEPALRVTATFLAALITFSTLLFALFYDLAPDDALYFATSIISTVGFGDFSLRHAPLPLKLYGSLLMLIGAASVAVLYAFVTDYIVRARLSRFLYERPLPQRGHVIVCGLGTIGYRVALAVQEAGLPVAAVDRDEGGRFTREARRGGLPVLVGDASLPETLRRAGAAGARCAIVCTSDDLANVQIALSAREGNPQLPAVVRLFDARLAALAQDALGLHLARSPAALAAPAFAAAALGEAYRDACTVDGHRLVVVELVPPPDALGQAPAAWPGEGIAALAISRSGGSDTGHPVRPAGAPLYGRATAAHVWADGDRLLAVCTLERAQAVLQPADVRRKRIAAS